MNLIQKIKNTGVKCIEISKLSDSILKYVGSYFNVYESKYVDSYVSVKIFTSTSKKLTKIFLREIYMLRNYVSENCLQFYGYILDTSQSFPIYGIVAESNFVSLREYIKNNKNMSYVNRSKMMLGAARGLSVLHTSYTKPFLHKNLGNAFYVTRDDVVKICYYLPDDVFSERTNFAAYFAYELLRDIFSDYNTKTEIYSFGIVMWEILTGTIPFRGMSYKEIYYMLIHENRGEYIPLDAPTELQCIIIACRGMDPDNRPTISGIVNVLEGFCSCHSFRHDR
ncbi:tyrosine protein kinase [Turkeypox virus]|uniref:Tyrosine protein kinase n=1 Tax=Turkeypox virus TaxID=336486 RepID=A0A0M3ZI07_9POXV|nr:tyrosine protein kinase [Turkeypox virus]ALA62524.1 tyrosine protein kinase [Turkeypox virus]